MENLKNQKGSCICGRISIHVPEIKKNTGACHCGTCRKWCGGPFLAVDCGTEVRIDGEENLGIYNSSDWAERGFCKNCGTNLFYRLKESRQVIASSQIFEGIDFHFDHQIFIDEKPDYYDFSNQTANMTGAEVFAAYARKN